MGNQFKNFTRMILLKIFFISLMPLSQLFATSFMPHSQYATGCISLLKSIIYRTGSPLPIKHLKSSLEFPQFSIPEERNKLLESITQKFNSIFIGSQFKGSQPRFKSNLDLEEFISMTNNRPTEIGAFIDLLTQDEKYFLTEVLFNFIKFYFSAAVSSYRDVSVTTSNAARDSLLWQINVENLSNVFHAVQELGYDDHLFDAITNLEISLSKKQLRHMLFRITPDKHLEALGLSKKFPSILANTKPFHRKVLWIAFSTLGIGSIVILILRSIN